MTQTINVAVGKQENGLYFVVLQRSQRGRVEDLTASQVAHEVHMEALQAISALLEHESESEQERRTR